MSSNAKRRNSAAMQRIFSVAEIEAVALNTTNTASLRSVDVELDEAVSDLDVERCFNLLIHGTEDEIATQRKTDAIKARDDQRDASLRRRRVAKGLPAYTEEERAELPKYNYHPDRKLGQVDRAGTRSHWPSHPDNKRMHKTGVRPWYRS